MTPLLPARLPQLQVSIDGAASGQLLKHSVYEYRYQDPKPDQPALALLMPASRRPTWQDGALFAVMDQNLPEGDLLLRLSTLFPKQQLQPMHLLAMVGDNGIGRLGFHLPGEHAPPAAQTISRETLLRMAFSPDVFDELVRAYLSTGAGIAGVQPKIMVPDRPTVPIPSLIVKATSPLYPGLAANEYLCLSAARRAGILTPSFELSDDGQMLVIDRFDLVVDDDGRIERLGFEDIASLMNLRVRDFLSERKYQGSYQRVAELLQFLQLPAVNLQRFFEQVALSVMVRNGDAHLKNFGVLYRSAEKVWLSPLFDVVTTAVYRYTRYVGEPEQEDRTLALKLFAGKHHSKAYPTTEELLQVGSQVCGVARPASVLARIAAGMAETLQAARTDPRIPADLLARMATVWQTGMDHARQT